MPIPVTSDARHLTLNGLADRLRGLNELEPSKELRSAGKNLYVKEAPAKRCNIEFIRIQHRSDAYALVRDSVREQYRCSEGDADRIMRNVLGDTSVVTVGDVLKLQELSGTADDLMNGTRRSPLAAFEEARLADELKGQGKGEKDALRDALFIEMSIRRGRSENSSVRGVLLFEKVAAGEMTALQASKEIACGDERDAFVEALKAMMSSSYLPSYGESDAVQRLTWRNIADVFSVSDLVPTEVADLLDARCKKSLALAAQDPFHERTPGPRASTISTAAPSESDVHALKAGRGIAEKVAAGGMTGRAARKALADRGARDAFFDALKDKMANLARYEQGSAEEQRAWRHIAEAYSTPDFVPFRKADDLGADNKASILQALSEKAIHEPTLPDMPETAASWKSLAEFHKLIKLNDMSTPDEQIAFDSFLAKCTTDLVLKRVKKAWPKLTEDERKAVIQNIVGLHAKQFRYIVPPDYVEFGDLGESTLGCLSNDGKKLWINSHHPDFDDLFHTFNTVIHESTHKYQDDIEKKLIGGALRPDSPSYSQARLIAFASRSTGMRKRLTEIGVRSDIAYAAYRQEPRELQAAYRGFDAEFRLRSFMAK